MTRIITLCSGLARAGKTHLGINLACEMVRRGRHAALYSPAGLHAGIDDLLDLPGTATLQRRETDHGDSLLRRSYLGVDMLSSGIPLSRWDQAPAEAVNGIITDMECADGYDDLLVDTSGMDPRTLLACARAASLVILMITGDPRSRAQTFAMIRILQLNGFEGELCLVINRVAEMVDANQLYATINGSLGNYLGLDVPLLGVMIEDAYVARAASVRQAFTSVFPDAEVSGQLIAIADEIDALCARKEPDMKTLDGYWNAFRETLAQPVSLPGSVYLAASEYTADIPAIKEPRAREISNDMMLLKLDSSFYALPAALDKLPGRLHATAEDVSALRRLLEEADGAGLQENVRETHDSHALPGLTVALIRAIEQAIVPAQALQLQVDENRVQGDDPDWLQDACYLKYIFRFQGSESVLSRIRTFLDGVTGFVHYTGMQGETIWEMVVADRSGGMNIIHSADDSIRVQVWLPLSAQPVTGRKSRPPIVTPSIRPGKTIH